MKIGKLSKILIVGITAISILSGCGKTGSSVKTEQSASKSDTFTYGIDGEFLVIQ